MTRTTPEVKMAVSGPTDTAKDTAHASEFTTGDSVTILETTKYLLTKVYKSDGSTDSYGDAASFKVREKEVGDISSLSAMLTELQDKPKCCQIHGKFVGKDKAIAGNVPGTYARTNQNFSDQPLHTFIIDVDKYKPSFGDPVHEPDICIQEYIRKVLPPEFQNVSFHWQLSSSAGQPSNLDVLKCHVWFWLETPRKCSELYEWAKVIGPQVDKVVYRRVQVRYTASPIFEEGRTDPVPVRSGLCRGLRDTLPLVIGEAMLAQARDQGTGEGGNDKTLVDPAEKDGLLGLFHKTFSAEQVLLELLEGEFIQASQRRFTWVNGGGTPEGVWVHDDDMHVGSSHNTWPIDGIANLWDLVREFKFGHLDRSDDAFEQVDLDNLLIQAKPSHLAMIEYASGLEEIKAAIAAEYTGELDRLKELISGAADAHALEHLVAPVIRQATDLDMTGKIQVEACFRDRWAALVAPAKVTIDRVRKLLAPPRTATADAGAPEWVAEWVWVTSLDKFMQIDTKETITLLSYSAKFDRYMQPFADAEGNVPKAADMSLRFWGTVIVSGAEYAPNAGLFFERDGLMMLNTYRPDLLPAMPEKYSKAELKAIETVETHLEILIPDARDRGLLIDFMAYCVQYPGKKIRWAPLLIGMEGDGKTAFLIMLGNIVGSRNTKTVSNKTLESDFTGWAGGACQIGIEEVKLHNHNRFDVFNALKPVISNDVIDFHAKGKDPVTIPNFCNLFMLTNHSDAMPVSSNDRRIFFLRSPYRSKAELYAAVEARTGMEADLFHNQLFDHAIKAHPGALRKWLMDRKFSNPDFKPNGRAPENAMRTEAIELSRTEEEIAIIGVIEAGAFGVYPNLVAGSLLTKSVTDQYDIKVSPTRFGAAMASLGWRRVAGYATQWRGKNYCWYYRDEQPSGNPAKLADKLEKARQDNLLGADFTD